MERIVVATGAYPLSNRDMVEVNNYLSQGWTVKSVTPQNTKDHMTVIFVLENHNDLNYLPYAGKYESSPLLYGNQDYIELCSNGTFTWSLYGGSKGTWLPNDHSIVFTPSDDLPPFTFPYSEYDNSINVNGRTFTKTF